jgi:hypothetical protein
LNKKPEKSRTRGPQVILLIFAVIWLVVIFFSSLQLNQQPDRERFFDGFSMSWFFLVGVLPILFCSAIFRYLQGNRKQESVHETHDHDS